MNIKLLKFIVIFMGLLIVFGIVSLAVTIFLKFQNISDENKKEVLFITPPNSMRYVSHHLILDQISITYENKKKIIINIFNIKNGKNIQKIEILK